MTSTAESPLFEILTAAKRASTALASLSPAQRQEVIERMAFFIDRRVDEILSANKHDMQRAAKLLETGEISRSMYDRLKLDENKLKTIVEGVRQVSTLPDPVGAISLARELDDGLKLYRVTSPIGVIAVIFESRPDVLPQIASLAIRSGNVAILKGGKEARFTLTVLFECLQQALGEKGLPSQSLVLLHKREEIESILKADGLVDLIIPRGSNQLVRYVQDNTRIPVLGHAEGLCALYVHEDADIDMAVKLAVDAKVQYPAACNAIETLLVHSTIAGAYLPKVAQALFAKGVELRADNRAFEIIESEPGAPEAGSESKKFPLLVRSKSEDWTTEFSDLILAVKVVDSIEEAIDHINQHGSNHTDTIVTAEPATYEAFFKAVNSAGVYWNVSTRFADGFRYGFGAEVGISTNKMHPRGPVGLEGLVTYKYKLAGKGHVVEDYSGENARQFKHRDIDL
ncbi:glutamate-5-semialdehyde dehydrogenase [Candidatus Obscuribacterales bacterium]|nr:glutamate-5-semialdehyde dehydrogenase [Candidatus Obscuribacterales bacterium]MBX3138175.1 glutamate-5-semialdehyde dehydrogenase [Candidatus Obscuribacterales bacterium]MBX3154179.1 glutamate-5-semialdehyde dehydrogenase [Candidatus Obscuribacterales bacterium]